MTPIEEYFTGEKVQCTIGIIIAAASIATALFLLLQVKTNFSKGVAYPFLAISVVLSAICIGVVFRSSKDIQRVNRFIEQDQSKIQADEIPRMEKVMRNFKIIKWGEICVFVIGLGLFLFSPNATLIKGVGLGLIIQAIMMYCFDFFAEHRGKIYWDFLQSLR